MAINDYWPAVVNTTATGIYGSPCNHGTPHGSPCFFCQHPAIGAAQPQTFQLGGWRCPGCGICWAPSVLACHNCPPQAPAGDGDGGSFHMVGEPLSDMCVPVSEGGLCDHGEEGDDGPCTSLDCSC